MFLLSRAGYFCQKHLGNSLPKLDLSIKTLAVCVCRYTQNVHRFRNETGIRAAFAKAVPNAMTKTVARLCAEIAQDHADALAGKLRGREK